MRGFGVLIGLFLLPIAVTYAYEIGQSAGMVEDYAIFGISGSGRAVATLTSVTKYDVPAGGFEAVLHWTNKSASWDTIYSVQCIDDQAGATPSVFDFDAPDGGRHYAIKQTASYLTEQEAFMHNLYQVICQDVMR